MANPNPRVPIAVIAAEVAPPQRTTNYPEPFASRMAGRVKRRLGDVFGLKNFGVNLTRIAPGGISALRHSHSKQDEFVYVLEGTATLVTDDGEAALGPGYCAGFRAGGSSHQLVNRTSSDVVFIEVGDRSAGDQGTYPYDDLRAELRPDGSWAFRHRDGTPY
jgi:uncharacterized cupin superfamily protein